MNILGGFMDKNNIFMWTYITFIFICCSVRTIIDFTMWNSIVIAVTVSSIFFSFEGLFSSMSDTYKKTSIIIERCVTETQKLLKTDMNSEKRIIDEYAKYKNKNPHIDDVFHNWENLQKCNKEISVQIKNIESLCNTAKRSRRTYNILAMAFAFCGFLCIFLIMIFVSYFYIPTKIQEIITVSSFGIILFTQQVNNISINNIKLQENATEDILVKYRAAVEETQNMEEKFINMIQLAQSIDNNTIT